MFSDAFGFDVGVARVLRQKDDDDAAVYMEKFIAKGSILATIEMAEYLMDKDDHPASLAWMARAEALIADDDPEAQLYLAGAWRRGLGAGTAQERYFRAFDLRERVAEAGHLATIREMVVNYLEGLNGAPKDTERAIHWLRKAAALGDEEAKKILGDEGLL